MEKTVSELLVERLPAIQRLAFRLTGNQSDADDLVQDACVRVLARARQFMDGTDFKAWTRTIVLNLWRDMIDWRAVRHGTKSMECIPESLTGSNLTVRRIFNLIGLNETGRAIEQLDEDKRTVLRLIVVENLSYSEAAAVMGVKPGTVMSRLSRSRKQIQKILGEDRIAA
jgi:RNA polymerase sigma-70 factor (ECF subfamily)